MKTTLSAVFLAVVFTNCTTTQPKAPPVALGPYSTPQKNVTITSRDRGTYVALQPKGTLTVALDSNTRAGYRWKLAQPVDPSILSVTAPAGSQLPPIALPPDTLTQPQAEQWIFKSVGPGTAKVRMIYARPNEPLNETASYDFTVNAE